MFRTIDYSKMALESLRDYFAVNKAGRLSYMYKFLLACIWPLQLQWNNFETYRQKAWLISQCAWSMGQLTALLNYLYDNVNFVANTWTISITQALTNQIYAPTFAIESTIYAPDFNEHSPSTTQEPRFNDHFYLSNVVINIPLAIYGDGSNAVAQDFIATLEKIRPAGVKYVINTI